MSGAGEQLQAAAVATLQSVAGIGGIYDGPPLHAAFPYAIVEVGPETDWSHKSGMGREVRLAVTVRTKSERPGGLYGLLGEVETAVGGLSGALPGWRVVTLRFLRSRLAREPQGSWAGLVEFRARMLAEPD